MSAIGAVLSSLNAAKDIAEAMIGLRDTTAFQSKVVEFQSKIIDAQNSVFAVQEERTSLIDKIRQLEKQVADFENWSTEAKRYELREFSNGKFTYVLKESQQDGEPVHAICANCYHQRKKSNLQGSPTIYGGGLAKCYVCKTELDFNSEDPRSPFRLKTI
jgi:hypothetical protein